MSVLPLFDQDADDPDGDCCAGVCRDCMPADEWEMWVARMNTIQKEFHRPKEAP